MMTMSYKTCIAAVLIGFSLVAQAFEELQLLHKMSSLFAPVVPLATGSLNMNRRFVSFVTFVVSDASG
jgi:hypothetical protein